MSTENTVELKGFSNDDVVSLSNKLYKVENIKIGLNEFLHRYGGNNDSAAKNLSSVFQYFGIDADFNEVLILLTEGTDSEILKVASNGWQKGKLKINVSLEFIPDKPEIPQYESPLDEIRREMNKNL